MEIFMSYRKFKKLRSNNELSPIPHLSSPIFREADILGTVKRLPQRENKDKLIKLSKIYK